MFEIAVAIITTCGLNSTDKRSVIMSQQDDASSEKFTIILTILACGIVGMLAFDQFVGKTTVSAEQIEANIKPVGQVNTTP